MQYCSLQRRTLLVSPVTSTTGYSFCFGSIPSFFLELFLYWSPVAYWAPTDLGISFFSILSFCLFILFMGFSRQEYWSGLPFPSPVDHILSNLSTMTRPSWNQRSNCQHLLDHQKSKRVPEKHLFLLYWLCQSLCVDHNKLWKVLIEMEYQATWPASWETCMQIRKQQLELDVEQQTGSK